jgi:TolB-like protein/DNA-binding winged helix-turn-helix (wHTH) protein
MAISSEAVRAQFADFELDLSSGELIRNGSKVRLQGQPFLVLHILLERSGEVVTREELQRILWPDETFVDFDQGLNKAIAKLRDALDDPKTSSALIQTLPRRGYRFTAPVNWIGSPNGVPASPRSAAPQTEIVSRHSIPIQYWIGGGLALALLLTTVLWINRHTVAEWISPRPVIQSLAVLPLKNLSNDPELQYLADGITDELITDLSYAKSLRVVSRSSSSRFKGSDLSAPEVARQLNVDGVIEGTVVGVNNSLRITIRLIAAKPDRQLWAASYERNIGDAVIDPM